MTTEIVRRRRGWRVLPGPGQAAVWRPAAAPGRAGEASREMVVDVHVEHDGSGYLLICESQDAIPHGDTWHETLVEAETAARERFGITEEDWEGAGPAAEPVPDGALSLSFGRSEALVLLELLRRLDTDVALGPDEQVLVADLVRELSTRLEEPRRADYAQLLAQARRALGRRRGAG
jgi:hypothetical protein